MYFSRLSAALPLTINLPTARFFPVTRYLEVISFPFHQEQPNDDDAEPEQNYGISQRVSAEMHGASSTNSTQQNHTPISGLDIRAMNFSISYSAAYRMRQMAIVCLCSSSA